MAGRFIAVEGGEGAGKSTALRTLAQTLRSEGMDVVLTREPGGTPWAEQIRTLLITEDDSVKRPRHPATQLLGMYAARMDHLHQLILPALAEGRTVLCDRFEVSTFAYQVYSESGGNCIGETYEIFKNLHAYVTASLRQYCCQYVLFDIEPKEGLRRIARRKGEEKTVFDTLPLDRHRAFRQGILNARSVIDRHFETYVLDAHQGEEEIVAEMRRLVGI